MAQQEHLGKLLSLRAEGMGHCSQCGTQVWGMWPGGLVVALRSAWGTACPVALGLTTTGPGPAGPAWLSSYLEPPVTTMAVGLCTGVTKCIHAQGLPGAASRTVSPLPSRSVSLRYQGLAVLLPGENEKSPRQTAIDGCGGGSTDRYWRYRRARQTVEEIERYLEQRDTAGGIRR